MEPIDENLKELMKELGTAINDTLSHSDRINEAIGKIRQAGYDVFLVLEATIGFNKREEGGVESGATSEISAETKLHMTSQDVKFLKSLKISIDEKDTE